MARDGRGRVIGLDGLGHSALVSVLLNGFPVYVPEFSFDSVRGWRFDFAWPSELVAVEIEGGVHIRGRNSHTGARGYEKDAWKYNRAGIAGWTVLRFTYPMLRDGMADCRDLLRAALENGAREARG